MLDAMLPTRQATLPLMLAAVADITLLMMLPPLAAVFFFFSHACSLHIFLLMPALTLMPLRRQRAAERCFCCLLDAMPLRWRAARLLLDVSSAIYAATLLLMLMLRLLCYAIRHAATMFSRYVAAMLLYMPDISVDAALLHSASMPIFHATYIRLRYFDIY